MTTTTSNSQISTTVPTSQVARYQKPVTELLHQASLEQAMIPNPIANIVKQQPKEVRKIIHALITAMVEQFNLSKPATQAQILGIVETFIRDYPTDSLDDIAYFCQQAATGVYGSAYGGIDQPTIFGWYRKYLDQKWEKKDDTRKQAKETESFEEVAELSEKTLALRKAFYEKLNTTPTPKPSPVRTSAYIPNKTKEQLTAEMEWAKSDERMLEEIRKLDLSDREINDLVGYQQELIFAHAKKSAAYLAEIIEKRKTKKP